MEVLNVRQEVEEPSRLYVWTTILDESDGSPCSVSAVRETAKSKRSKTTETQIFSLSAQLHVFLLFFTHLDKLTLIPSC